MKKQFIRALLTRYLNPENTPGKLL